MAEDSKTDAAPENADAAAEARDAAEAGESENTIASDDAEEPVTDSADAADADADADADAGGTPPALTHDGLDPELLTLPRFRGGTIGPILSISVIVFCCYIMWRVYPDLRFSYSSSTPTSFDSAGALLQGAEAESFVQAHLVPDRAFAVHVAHSQADDGGRMSPVQGTNGALWLAIGGNVWATTVQYDEVYSGRLRKIGDMPFYEELKRHVRERKPEPRFVQPNALREALANAGAAVLRDPTGDSIQVAATTRVHLYVTMTNRVRIHFLPTDRISLDDFANGLATLQLEPLTSETGPDGSRIYIVDVPGGVAAAQAMLRAAKLTNDKCCTPIKRIYEVAWSELVSQGETLRVGTNTLAWSDVTWSAVDVTRELDANAWILLTQEVPENYWYVKWLFGLLAVSALFFMFALLRSLLPRR